MDAFHLPPIGFGPGSQPPGDEDEGPGERIAPPDAHLPEDEEGRENQQRDTRAELPATAARAGQAGKRDADGTVGRRDERPGERVRDEEDATGDDAAGDERHAQWQGVHPEAISDPRENAAGDPVAGVADETLSGL